MTIYSKTLELYKQYKMPLVYSFLVSILISMSCLSNGYYSTEDFTYANEMLDGSENKTFLATCIYDGKYTLYVLFHLMKALKINDTLALAIPYLLLFKLQLIIGGILIIRELKINLSLGKTVLALSLLAANPYLIESAMYKHYFGFQSASFCYLFIIIAVLLLRRERPIFWLSFLLFVLAFGVYQTMINVALCLISALVFIELMRDEKETKAVLISFLKQVMVVVLAGVFYIIISKIFTSVVSDNATSRIALIQNFDQLLQVCQSIGLALARAFTQGVAEYNLVDRIAFLVMLISAFVYGFKQSFTAGVFLIIAVLSNFAVFFIINPNVGAILPRTLTSIAFFTFVVIIWSFTYEKAKWLRNAFTICGVVMIISYASVWSIVVNKNVLNKQRDFALANTILQEVYKVDDYKNKQIYYFVGTDEMYDLEDHKSTMLATHTNFSAYNNDQNFPHQLLQFVSGITLQKVLNVETQLAIRNQFPYEQFKQKGKRFNLVIEKEYILIYL